MATDVAIAGVRPQTALSALGLAGTGGDDSILLLALAALVAAMVATATPLMRRRLGRGVGFLLGCALGGAAFVGLAGLAVLWLGGADALRRATPAFAPPPAALPQVHTPGRPVASPADRHPGGTVLAGTVTHVRDGDTVVVSSTPVRFTDIDCAERGTSAGERATEAMRRLADGQMVRCHLIGRRSYDREIGTCALGDGRDLGMTMVAAGLCARR